MGTPQKSVGRLLESPYAKHLQQYPSQSEEFMPNEFGGKNWVPSSTPFQQQHQGNNNYQHNLGHRRRGNNRYFNANRGDSNCGNNPKGGGGYRNYQNNYQNNCNPQQSQRHSNIGNRQQPYHGQKFNKSEGSLRNDYYHPSMLSDPWKELLDRHQAIKNSQIDVSSFTTAEEQEHGLPPEGKPSPQQDSTKTAIPLNAMTTGVETTKGTSP